MAPTRQTRLAQLRSLLDALPSNIFNQPQHFRVDPGEMNDDGYTVAVNQDSGVPRPMLAEGEGAVGLAQRVSGRKNLSPLACCALYT